MQPKPLIYVCSPLKGDIERNINKAKGYSRFVFSKGGIPITPHVYFTQFLDDTIQEEREAGLRMGLELLFKCKELWAFGDRISEGMAMEMAAAATWNIKVRRFDERCVEYKPSEEVHDAK